MRKYIFHSDAGHGWLEVPKSELKSLGIKDKISRYSYIDGDNAYLEEDCDASVFIKAICEANNMDEKMFNRYIEENIINGTSVIRQMPIYQPNF